jgi:hypothetical protein
MWVLLTRSTEMLAAWVFAYLGFAFLLSSFGLRGGINWFLTVGVALLLVILSLAMHATQLERERDPPVILSPIVAHSLWVERPSPDRGRTTTNLHWLAGIACFAAGVLSMRSQRLPAIGFRRPGYEFLSSREGHPPAAAGPPTPPETPAGEAPNVSPPPEASGDAPG